VQFVKEESLREKLFELHFVTTTGKPRGALVQGRGNVHCDLRSNGLKDL